MSDASMPRCPDCGHVQYDCVCGDEGEYEPAFVEGDDVDEDVLAEEAAIAAMEEEAAMACPRCGAQPEDCVCQRP